MLAYPVKATTTKTVSKFTYNMYLDASVNMLKYNNDSSATLRVLSAIVDTSQDVLEDLNYIPTFNLSGLDFTTIDRFNGFTLNRIPGLSIKNVNDTIYAGRIKGYSKYTGASYTLEYIPKTSDFVRHSMPCDAFFGEEIVSDGYQLVALSPNVKKGTDIRVDDSAITVRPYSGFSSNSMLDGNAITLTIYGISTTGTKAEESIIINSMTDFVTRNEYSFITGVIATGSIATVSVIIYPYINGEYVRWDNDIVDKKTGDIYSATLSIDVDNKTLDFSTETDLGTGFPISIEAYKKVNIDIADNEQIWNYYIDVPNRLVYILSSASKLYCYPLIIPITYNKDLDFIKTQYQSIRVDYEEDSINQIYSFYVFPSHKTVDIETMSIVINGEEYQGNILLDLIRENIETNRFDIPFSELFKDGENCLIEFRTYGIQECVLPIWLDNSSIKPLYVKDLTAISGFQAVSNGYINPATSTNAVPYKQYVAGDMGITNDSMLIKLSSCGNVILNGYKINNVFKTFTYDDSTGIIITSDTITNTQAA